MRVTVCELPTEPEAVGAAWEGFATHCREQRTELAVLPEMPFSPWLASGRTVDRAAWMQAVAAHDEWITRLGELGADVVVGTAPVTAGGTRHNEAFAWWPGGGRVAGHRKHHLPDEAGFWEATWYEPGPPEFAPLDTPLARLGFLVCTELWFLEHARAYGEHGVDVLASPRATPASSRDKWIAGARTAAVVSGAFCVSSNHAGAGWAGAGWVIHPEEGDVLALTSTEQPFETCDIDLADARAAKSTYPRYVRG